MHLQRFFYRLLILIGCMVQFGCAAGNNAPAGKWETDTSVQQLFQAGTVLPDHAYYYIGSIAAPVSIIAISKQFTLRSKVWAEVDLTTQMLNEWLQWFRTEQYGAGCEYRGGVILTPDGQQAGIWYSQNILNIVRVPEPGVIEVYQPHSLSGTTCGHESDNEFPGGWF